MTSSSLISRAATSVRRATPAASHRIRRIARNPSWLSGSDPDQGSDAGGSGYPSPRLSNLRSMEDYLAFWLAGRSPEFSEFPSEMGVEAVGAGEVGRVN